MKDEWVVFMLGIISGVLLVFTLLISPLVGVATEIEEITK